MGDKTQTKERRPAPFTSSRSRPCTEEPIGQRGEKHVKNRASWERRGKVATGHACGNVDGWVDGRKDESERVSLQTAYSFCGEELSKCVFEIGQLEETLAKRKARCLVFASGGNTLVIQNLEHRSRQGSSNAIPAGAKSAPHKACNQTRPRVSKTQQSKAD